MNRIACMAVGASLAFSAGADDGAYHWLRYFRPEAARLAVEDLKSSPGYDYPRHRAAVETLAGGFDSVTNALVRGTAEDRAAAERVVAGYRAAMLANPLLDFDRILCVKRDLKVEPWPEYGVRPGGSDTPCGPARAVSRNLGLLGLNAHNHMDMRRAGFTNSISVVSALRTTPRFETLYAPPNTEIVRDLDLDFDASRILFTSARGTNNLLGVYEMKLEGLRGLKGLRGLRGSEGCETNSIRDTRHQTSNIKHQTPNIKLLSPEDGKFDIQWWDGCYLPNRDQVIMLGTAAYQFLPCEEGNYPMCVLYRLDRRTGEVRQLTYEQDSDYTPSVLNDGRVSFTRWEYSDVQHYFSRELMTMNPDGTSQLALWGSGSWFPTFFAWARAIPGDPHRLVMMAGGHHGRAEHGRMLMVDPSLARAYPFRYDPPDRSWGPVFHTNRVPVERLPADETGFVHEFPGRGEWVEGDVSDLQVDNQHARGRPYFAHPWPLSDKYFLVSAKPSREARFGIYLMDVFDNFTLVAENPDGVLFEPIPLAPRPRPPVLPDRTVKGAKTCSVHIADVYAGPGLRGVPRGTVKKLRVFAYHFCYHKTGGHVSLGLDRAEAGWDLKRILGTADVEKDGSCCFEMPCNVPVSFQPLDADGHALQLMRSWTVGMPGERVSCTGCHEDNRTSVPTKRTIADQKFHRGEIAQLTSVDDEGIRPWGFEAELHPQLKRSCVACHVKWTDAKTAYRAIHPFVRRGGAESELAILNPLEFHVSTSPLVQMLEKGHHGARVTPELKRKIGEWIDLNCPFFGCWNPPAFKTDNCLPGCTNQVMRRRELNARYNQVADDPEAEYARHVALLARRGDPKPLAPQQDHGRAGLRAGRGRDGARPSPPAKWPMSVLESADAQLGAIDEVAPVTTRTLILSDGEHMTFRRIPAGEYLMGSTNGYPDEVVRRVRIEKPFWIGETEVENSQYHAFDPAHSSRYQDQYGYDQVVPGFVGTHRRQPAVRLSREEAEGFCAWLSKRCGVTARLPTEEEWEWAARSGTATPFPWGGLDDDFSKWANLADRDVRFCYFTWDGAGTLPQRRPYAPELNYPLHDERFQDDWFSINFVGRARPNRWGLYDMHGNAAEWTSSTDGGKAVVRGGSFASRPKNATSSFRQRYLPWQKVFDVGFRVVLEEE